MTHCRKWEHSGGFEEKELRFKKKKQQRRFKQGAKLQISVKCHQVL